MKKYLLIFVLALPIFIGQGVRGQQYVPLVDTNKVWSVFDVYRTLYLKIGGDTIIDSKQYKKMYRTTDTLQIMWNRYAEGIREEDKRIYVKFDSDERMLYDFNIEVGDTFFTTIEYYPHCQMVVSSIDSVELENNEFRRRIVFSYESNTPNVSCGLANNLDDEEWIEGIGSKRGLLSFFLYYASLPADYLEALLCFHENDTLKYINSNIPVCYLAGNTQEYDKSQNIKVYPNPFSDYLTLEFEDFTFNHCTILLYNTLGVEVQRIDNITQNRVVIQRNNLPQGFYFLRVICDNKNLGVRKIIIQLFFKPPSRSFFHLPLPWSLFRNFGKIIPCCRANPSRGLKKIKILLKLV